MPLMPSVEMSLYTEHFYSHGIEPGKAFGTLTKALQRSIMKTGFKKVLATAIILMVPFTFAFASGETEQSAGQQSGESQASSAEQTSAQDEIKS
jgi:hypothetical protein